MPKKIKNIDNNADIDAAVNAVPDTVKPNKTRKIQKLPKIQKTDAQKKIDKYKDIIAEYKTEIAKMEIILNEFIEEKSREIGLTLFRRQLATQEKKLEKLIAENGDFDV